MPDQSLSLEPILRAATGYWATSAIRAGLRFRIFTHVAAGVNDLSGLSEVAGIAPRGARALLDALTGLQLLQVEDRRYTNSAVAERFLVEDSPTYLGTMVLFITRDMAEWEGFGDAVQSGTSVKRLHSIPDHPYWDGLVRGIAPLAVPVAEFASRLLGIADKGAIDILDIGGGAGAYSGVFLRDNPHARSTQIDWNNVNAVATEFVATFGVEADRFRTVGGDFREVEYGESCVDVIVYSQMAHGFDPPDNIEAFHKMRRALRPGGVLVISEYLVNDDGSAHPWVLLFSANILFHSPHGAGFREDEYRAWLAEAGFHDVERVETPLPATLLIARLA